MYEKLKNLTIVNYLLEFGDNDNEIATIGEI